MAQPPHRRRGPGRPPTADSTVPGLDRVLGRALEAFAEQGYEAVSVRALNAALGMGHTFIADRYGSKERFWRAVVVYAVDRVRGEVAGALADDGRGDAERLAAAVRAFHRQASGSAHFARLVSLEAATDSPRLDFLYGLVEPVNEAVRPLFDRLTADGTLRPMPWYVFHFLVTGSCGLYGQLPLARRFGRPAGTDQEAEAELLADLVLAACFADGPPTPPAS
ncbi:TetR/AcrR family transcriptional regulator [Streptomyces sp. DSS69]|uniref:TetR/AcrR family transcriptional regulator n=1 Tax=unclassified Streptomyces TaxID=2593676 RepID=UPI0031F842D2